jgi:ABC-type dipeptide/oligopeptide/nickel transport system permease component
MRNVSRLLAQRIVLAMPILLAVVVFTFLLIRVGNNDPIGMLAGPTAGAAEIAAIRAQYKLDQPVLTQFADFAWRVAHGDLGRSWLSNRPVADELLTRLPATLELIFWGALIGALVGIPAGMTAAFRANRRFDHVSRLFSLFGFGMPTIFLGLALIYVFFFVLGWAPPPMGRVDLMINAPSSVTGSYLVDALIARDFAAAASAAGRLVLPTLAIAIVFAAPLIKQTRAIALDVLGSDFIRYARASGLPPDAVRRMVWRNSSVPVITYGASELTALFGSASVLELIFSWGGISQYGLTAILKGDFAVVQGYVLIMSLIAMVVFALADLMVLWIEPRARSRDA